jgi:predicted nucleic acid-binding protein
VVQQPRFGRRVKSDLELCQLTKRVAALQNTAQALVDQYIALVTLVVPKQVPAVITRDADDEQVLACAVEAHAHLIATGDQHLHGLGGAYQGVRILTPTEAVALLNVLYSVMMASI